MSTTIDQKVVEMRFDNKNFESNVQTSMGTLEKLKRSLNLSGASKGLENVNAAAKNVNLNPLGAAVETVQAKFSALQVVGITTLANITNSAVNAEKQMIKALTIDPVKTGLSEYETKINAIQVIKSNTRGKNTMDDITSALDDLNEYADKTIYNFAQMTDNIGKFTAQGLDVYQAAEAVKGMANLAAASGASATDMARATYQISQSLSSTIKLMDWNSLRNANMATTQLKDTLIDLAKVNGVAIDDMIAKHGSFEQTLSEGWLSGEMFTEAMNIYSGVYDDAELAAKGFTEAQIKNFKSLAQDAESAATEVKTFTQLFDVLKETAQSGWTQTWELIIGDFDSAKKMFTEAQIFFGDIINGFSAARNNLLEGALNLGKPWKSIMDKLEGAGLGNIKKVAETVEDVTNKLEHFQDIVNKVWRGDFGNSDTGRFEKLEAAGYDHRVVQDLVNKGLEYKLTMEDIEASHKKFGLTMDKTKTSTEDLTVSMENLTDKQLKEAGLTEAEIKLYHDLAEEAKRSGKSVSELAEEMSKNDGRTLLLDSLKNAGNGIISVFKAMKDAWRDIFPPMSVVTLYNLVKSLNDFSKKLVMSEETAGKLQRTFKGLFAIIDIIATIAGGGLKIAFKFLTQLLGYFNLDILDVTASIGDAVVKFRDWIDNTLDFTKAIEKIGPYLEKAITAVKDWFNSLKESDNIPRDIILGLINGLKEGVGKVGEAIVELAKTMIEKIKSFLGIHSPSTVFITIGAMIIAGLVLGLLNGNTDLWDTVKGIGATIIDAIKEGIPAAGEAVSDFFNKISESVKNADVKETVDNTFSGLFEFIKTVFSKIGEVFGEIDFGALLGTGLIVGMLLTIKKVADVAEKFANPFDKLGGMFEGIGDMFTGLGKSFQASAFLKKTQGIYNLAKALALLAVSFVLLASVSWADIGKGVVVIGVLGLVLGGLALAVSKINPGDFNFKFGFESGGILALAASLLIVAIAVKKLAEIDQTELAQGVTAVVILSGIMALLIQATKYAGKDLGKLGSTLIKMSVAILILVYVAKILGEMKTENLVQGIIGIAAFGGIMVGLVAMTKLAGGDVDKVGGTIFKMALAILLLVGVAKLIAMMPGEELAKGIIGIIAFGSIVTGLIAATRLAGGAVADKLGRTILAVAGAMMLLALTAKILAGMSVEELVKGVTATVILGGIITGLIAATRLAGGGDLTGVAATIIAASVAIGILAAVATILGFMSIEHLTKGVAAVGLLSTMMAGLIVATRGASDCKGNLIVMAVAIGVMAAAVIALSLIDSKKLAVAAGSLGILMGMFALMTKVAGTAKSSMASLIIMTIAVGLLGGILYLLAQLPVEQSIGSAIALSVLMLAMAGALFIMSAISTAATQALIGIGLLTLMAVPLITFVGVLAVMQNIQNALANTQTLIILATAMTLLLIPLTLIGVIIGATGGLALIGILGLLLMAVPLIAFVGVLAVMQNIQNATANTELLIGLVTTMSDVLVKLALIAPLAVMGVGALTALTALMAGIGLLAVGLGALMEKFPAIEQFLNTGIPILERLAYTIGSLVANVISGFVDNLDLSGLVGIGVQLSMFMIAAQPFIQGAKLVDESVLIGVGVLVGAILALTAADVISGIMPFISGADGFVQLGTQLSQFMINAWPFLMMASTINPAIMEGVKALAEAVLILTGAKLLEGITSFITGGVSLSDFGAQLGDLAIGLKTFATNLGEFDESKVTTVTNAAKAIKAIAEAADTLPNEGGWAAKIFGDNSLATFGTKLPQLGYNLKTFATNLGTFDEEKKATIQCACDAIKAMAEAADSIPNEGGIWGAIFGDNSLATFGANLPGLGTNLNSFVTNLGTFDEDKVATIDCAVKAIKAMADAAAGIDGQSEWAKKLFGDDSLSAFGDEMASFGSSLKTFVTNLGTFGDDKVATVNCAVKAIKALTGLADANLKGANKNLSGFGEDLPGFAEDITSFVDGMPSGESVSAAVTSVNYLITLISNIASAKTADLSTFADSLKSIGTDGVDAFVTAFSDGSAIDKVEEGASDMVTAFIDGAESELSSVESAFESIASAGASAAKTKYQAFHDAGAHLVGGFANGITAHSYKAAAKAKAMAEAAEQAAKEALDINSPSKVFRAIGMGVPEGFAQGVGKFGYLVKGSVESMSQSAISSVSRSIARISDVINSDVDAQPTIRPVLDLSDVESGAGRISNLMNMGNSIGVSANVGAISSMMNARSQNGTNADIVSAIDKLRSDIGNMDRASYNINGITYDDGSNITNAVQTLVRAAKIERRV